MEIQKTADELSLILRELGGKIGLALEPIDVIRAKLIERLDYGPEREFPIKLPDGVVYWGAGSQEYPKDHQYSKMSQILCDIQRESPVLQKRIEDATGMFAHRWGARYEPLKAIWLRLRYVFAGK